MQFGVLLPHLGHGASPEAIRDVSQAAEDLGYDSLWVGDHIAPPRHTSALYGVGPTGEPWQIPDGALAASWAPLFEGLTTLSYVAGLTKRVCLGTAVCVLPLRNPVYSAKQLATLDVLCGGRLSYGVGSGWLREEAEALQMPWDHRGARTDEHIAVLRALWTAKEPYVSFHGRFYSFEEIAPDPRPVQHRLPILIGGHSPVAQSRAGRLGDGWLTSNVRADHQARGIAKVREIAAQHGRDPDQLLFVGSLPAECDAAGRVISPKINAMRRAMVALRPETSPATFLDRARAYRDGGTQHLIVHGQAPSPDEWVKLLRLIADDVFPELR